MSTRTNRYLAMEQERDKALENSKKLAIALVDALENIDDCCDCTDEAMCGAHRFTAPRWKILTEVFPEDPRPPPSVVFLKRRTGKEKS